MKKSVFILFILFSAWFSYGYELRYLFSADSDICKLNLESFCPMGTQAAKAQDGRCGCVSSSTLLSNETCAYKTCVGETSLAYITRFNDDTILLGCDCFATYN